MAYWVYLMASKAGTLYLGVTNNLARRTEEHKAGLVKGFSKRYGCKKLVYVEEYDDIKEAITREKQIKRWSRKKKEQLIKQVNSTWQDLSEEM